MANPGELDGLTILILEDELAISSALRDFFLLSGARRVEVTSSVANAFELMEEIDFDAAVLDVLLPDGEAFGLAAELGNEGVALVFHTGHDFPGDRAFLTPMTSFVRKPSEPAALVASIVELLQPG